MNIAVICIILAGALIYVSKIPVAIAMAKLDGRYDNHHPRAQQARLTGFGARALAAHQNAIEAFPKAGTGGQVIVSSRDQAEAGLCLQVKDTGKGMSKEVKEQVFENLFTTKGARGTGLGLVITQKIIDEHGGTIQVESEPNKGSCFTIVLPKDS